MGIFDLFKQKRNPLAELNEVKDEIHESTAALQTTSSQLGDQIVRLESIQNGKFVEWMEKVQYSLEENRKEISKTSSLMSSFNIDNLNDDELKEQIKFVTKNLNILNTLIELELADANSHLRNFSEFCYGTVDAMTQSQQLVNALPSHSVKLSDLGTKVDLLISSIDKEEVKLD